MAKAVGGVVGFWKDEHALLHAAEKVRDAGFKKFDAITPFPVHGMDDAIGIKRSFLPWVTLVMGSAGCAAGLLLQWYVAAYDWPLNVGGKPAFSLPAFIPVVFECTVLFGALSTVAALFVVCRMPRLSVPVVDPRLTDDKFALVVPENDVSYSVEKVESLFKQIGATDVRRISEF